MSNATSTKGRHSELISQTALLANGWEVAEPIVPSQFDLLAKHLQAKKWVKIQIKTARYRVKDGAEWIVVTGTRNNGQVYSTDEVDAFIGVYDGVAYMFDNRGISEYWCKPAELSERWTRLDASINNIENKSERLAVI